MAHRNSTDTYRGNFNDDNDEIVVVLLTNSGGIVWRNIRGIGSAVAVSDYDRESRNVPFVFVSSTFRRSLLKFLFSGFSPPFCFFPFFVFPCQVLSFLLLLWLLFFYLIIPFDVVDLYNPVGLEQLRRVDYTLIVVTLNATRTRGGTRLQIAFDAGATLFREFASCPSNVFGETINRRRRAQLKILDSSMPSDCLFLSSGRRTRVSKRVLANVFAIC